MTGNEKKHIQPILSRVADQFVERLLAEDLPFQKSEINAIPINVYGKPIGNINFILLASPLDQDPRWASTSDISVMGLNVKPEAKPRQVVFYTSFDSEIPVNADSENELPETKKIQARRLVLVDVYMASDTIPQTGPLALPEYKQQKADYDRTHEAIMQLVNNAGLKVSAESSGQEIAEGDSLRVNLTHGDMNSLGKLAHALSRWARLDTNLSRPMDETGVRQLLVEAITTSMLCAEFGAAMPESLSNEVNQAKGSIIKYIKDDPRDLMVMAKEAGAACEFVAQFASSHDITHEDDVSPDENDPIARQSAKNLF